LSRGCRRHIAIALRGSTRHENTRRRDCEATSVAIGPSMRSGSICATWPFDPRAAPSQALPPYKKIALSYRHVLPQPYAELQGPAPVQLNGHRSPLTPPLPAVQLNQGFFEVATLDRRYAHSALTTSKKPPDSKDLDLLRGAEREQQRSFRSQARVRLAGFSCVPRLARLCALAEFA